ncbi:hypothetical protein DFR50_12679 [Roseiarcus fermentans]|uniref:Uncharacterized protein n=1 Tax=Roseiarcus fermentans TaxID=1473586 RepID=A0A366F0V5_9HYPH|nr:hypothetical protein [Roseiarcus fermentans]RBP08234.1 hypothetical protein DFR50_12679 [Roseiarcus fermentans]
MDCFVALLLAMTGLGVTLALCGRTAEARSEVAAGLRLAPDLTVGRYRADALACNTVYLEQRERILAGLRLAGAPEG